MEGFLFTFPPFSNPACAAPAAGSGWRKGRFMTPQGLDYLELCKALLSPVPPASPFKKADTKECGVQVNAKVHKTVQCSLGPKTLFWKDPVPEKSPTLQSSPLRFLRPVSIYSPVFDRRKLRDESEEELHESEQDSSLEKGEGTFLYSQKTSNFQFLEQRYGFFHCKKCNIRWESAYVWCISGTSKVFYKQLCRKCQVGFNPYKVESIICKGCSQTCCSCERKQRHINMKRPHRQDLCCRCKGMRLSCDATYSFKYIV
ncbi:ZAR1-like protein [Synchiropus splendidus]|uniref:ZAR1-like protein n=1 Tax=Synchiropus splendidus TaxID=270530 RepID=UPI00237D3DDB|nr:ZAR1-like protein [Synchiropus splendidus]